MPLGGSQNQACCLADGASRPNKVVTSVALNRIALVLRGCHLLLGCVCLACNGRQLHQVRRQRQRAEATLTATPLMACVTVHILTCPGNHKH